MAAVAVIPGSEASRLAQFIGLPRWREFDDLQLVDSVRKGFPLKSAATVVSRVDPEGRFLTAADIIPKSTLSRRQKNQGPLSMAESEKVLALAKMLSELIRIYKGDTELAGLFLQRKLVGSFLLLARLGARVDARSLILPFLPKA